MLTPNKIIKVERTASVLKNILVTLRKLRLCYKDKPKFVLQIQKNAKFKHLHISNRKQL